MNIDVLEKYTEKLDILLNKILIIFLFIFGIAVVSTLINIFLYKSLELSNISIFISYIMITVGIIFIIISLIDIYCAHKIIKYYEEY